MKNSSFCALYLNQQYQISKTALATAYCNHIDPTYKVITITIKMKCFIRSGQIPNAQLAAKRILVIGTIIDLVNMLNAHKKYFGPIYK